MDADKQNGHEAVDIITYIGVPLAVLGVLPIMYNTAATLATLSRLRRLLRHCKLPALTRSDVVNRVIEVELPRYAVRPMDRFADREQYWTLSRHPSNIPGGSWTTFNWRTNVIGHSTQRLEYVDQLRQPQVEVEFADLVCYLLDLGAVPDPHGWRLLRTSGLWAPVGCALMKSPDGTANALTIAPLDGSDGHLSLAVYWEERWTTRDAMCLPPYWVRLPPFVGEGKKMEEEGKAGESKPEEEDKRSDDANTTAATCHLNDEPEASASKANSVRKPSTDTTRYQPQSFNHHPITCQISTEGIVTAYSESPSCPVSPSASVPSIHTTASPTPSLIPRPTLSISHLLIRGTATSSSNNGVGVWFASAATAYGTTSQTILWNYKIPEEILAFSRRETVPCGVLVLLGVVQESDTPEWMSETLARQQADDRARQMEDAQRRAREYHEAMMREAKMSPQERSKAQMERMRREADERMRELRERERINAQRAETRTMEALQSPRWDNTRVAKLTLAWLVQQGHLPSTSTDIRETVGGILHRMVLEGEFAVKLCGMLDRWKAWSDIGGMKRADLEALKEDIVTFAYATMLVAVIKDTATAAEGTVAMDLQECMRTWKIVRLG